MRILLTGSAGFIGTNLSARLLDDGHRVIGVDNYLSGRPENTARFRGRAGFDFVRADVSAGIPPVSGALDWVLHFASPASPPLYQRHPIATLLAGAHGTYHALELARTKGARFLLASTSEVYGDPDVHPQPEDYWGNVNPNGPRSCYDEAKRYAEALTMAFRRHHGVDTRLIRIFNTYGPHMQPDDGRVVSNFINQALRGRALTVHGDGRQTRSFQYVDDLVRGVLRVMEVDHHDPVNLGNPQECSVIELAKFVRDMIAPDLPIRCLPRPANDPRRRKPDIGLARRLLGWEPRVDLEEGLERTIAYFRSQLEGEPRPAVAGVAR